MSWCWRNLATYRTTHNEYYEYRSNLIHFLSTCAIESTWGLSAIHVMLDRIQFQSPTNYELRTTNYEIRSYVHAGTRRTNRIIGYEHSSPFSLISQHDSVFSCFRCSTQEHVRKYQQTWPPCVSTPGERSGLKAVTSCRGWSVLLNTLVRQPARNQWIHWSRTPAQWLQIPNSLSVCSCFRRLPRQPHDVSSAWTSHSI
jgi:hypothetical protein